MFCWLCDSLYHAKYVDLAPRTGLRGCCKKGPVFDIEFYKLFKNIRTQLNDMDSDLNNSCKKFPIYKEVLKKTHSSPTIKKHSKKASPHNDNAEKCYSIIRLPNNNR